VVQFANEAFVAASGRERISWRTLVASESIYSTKRLHSLFEEWYEVYPNLKAIVELLRSLPESFTRSSITKERIENACMTLCSTDQPDEASEIADRLFNPNNRATEADALSLWLCILYQVGAISIKISSTESYRWSYIDQPTITTSEAKRAIRIKVHKMLHRALEIQNRPLERENTS
jgi:hypothetical protein